jgi:hypothetical protein
MFFVLQRYVTDGVVEWETLSKKPYSSIDDAYVAAAQNTIKTGHHSAIVKLLHLSKPPEPVQGVVWFRPDGLGGVEMSVIAA